MGKVYLFSELKGIIRVGDKVKDPSSIDYKHLHLTANEIATVTAVRKYDFDIDGFSYGYYEYRYLELLDPQDDKSDEPAPAKTWETLAVGDVIVGPVGSKAKVLAVLPEQGPTQVFLCSQTHGFEEIGSWYTLAEAQRYDWTIEGAAPVKTRLTKREIADKFNINVEDLEIEG